MRTITFGNLLKQVKVSGNENEPDESDPSVKEMEWNVDGKEPELKKYDVPPSYNLGLLPFFTMLTTAVLSQSAWREYPSFVVRGQFDQPANDMASQLWWELGIPFFVRLER